jgi:hypothetical protein
MNATWLFFTFRQGSPGRWSTRSVFSDLQYLRTGFRGATLWVAWDRLPGALNASSGILCRENEASDSVGVVLSMASRPRYLYWPLLSPSCAVVSLGTPRYIRP